LTITGIGWLIMIMISSIPNNGGTNLLSQH